MKKSQTIRGVDSMEKTKQDVKAITSHRASSYLSKAAMEIAKNSLEEFKSQSDEAFLLRAKINRKLGTL